LATPSRIVPVELLAGSVADIQFPEAGETQEGGAAFQNEADDDDLYA